MARSVLDGLLDEVRSRPVRGWDFEWLRDRVSATPLPWSFEDRLTRHARGSPDLLDLGTGGGEWVARLPYRPPRTVATEAYPPNVDIAGARLRPLHVTVVRVEAAPDNADQRPGDARGGLPFPAESFALVSSRHESYVAAEIARVLVHGGRFLTQQMGDGADDYRAALGLRPDHGPDRWTLDLASRQIEDAGMRVVAAADAVAVRSFADVGAFAWYLKAIPWIVPGFSIEANREALERLQERIDAEGPVRVREPAFWLEAVKP